MQQVPRTRKTLGNISFKVAQNVLPVIRLYARKEA
jgi:hypothetical protein